MTRIQGLYANAEGLVQGPPLYLPSLCLDATEVDMPVRVCPW